MAIQVKHGKGVGAAAAAGFSAGQGAARLRLKQQELAARSQRVAREDQQQFQAQRDQSQQAFQIQRDQSQRDFQLARDQSQLQGRQAILDQQQAFQLERDQAGRDFARESDLLNADQTLDRMFLQADLNSQAAQEAQARRRDDFEYEYTEQQRREQQKLEESISFVQRDHTLTREQKLEALDQLYARQMGIQPVRRMKQRQADPTEMFQQQSHTDSFGNVYTLNPQSGQFQKTFDIGGFLKDTQKMFVQKVDGEERYDREAHMKYVDWMKGGQKGPMPTFSAQEPEERPVDYTGSTEYKKYQMAAEKARTAGFFSSSRITDGEARDLDELWASIPGAKMEDAPHREGENDIKSASTEELLRALAE